MSWKSRVREFVRRAGYDPLGRAFHLFEFQHQVLFRMQTAGGVYYHIIGLACGGGLQRVIVKVCPDVIVQ